jgi:two-component system, NtrC family, sensor kinase
MTLIIRQLLDFARRRDPERSPADVEACAAQTLSLLSPLAVKRGITLELAAAEPPLTAYLDVGQIQQALTNLVVNGMQAMPKGGKLTVGVRRERAVPPADHGGPAGEYLCLWVEDQGVGMSDDVRAHVFEPFYTTKDVGEGTGLGLSVAYGIVREHGGWIAVESYPERGSRFSIYLPLDSIDPLEAEARGHAT